MTRDQIAIKVRQFLNDAGVFYTGDDINDSMQDGYDEVSAYCGNIEKMVAIDFVPGLVYYDFRAIIPDFVSLIAIWNRRVKRWMTSCSGRDLDNLRENWEVAVGEPYLFWPINYRYVAIFPTIAGIGEPTTNKMYVVYKAAADTLSGDTEPQIPDDLEEDILMHYVTMDMFEQAEEWTKAGEHRKHYIEKIDDLHKRLQHRDGERLLRLGGN